MGKLAWICRAVVWALLLVQIAVCVDSPANSPVQPPQTGADSPRPPATPPRNAPVSSPSPPPTDSSRVRSSGPSQPPLEPISGFHRSNGMSGAQKFGIAIGVIAAVGLAGFGGFVYKKRRDNIRRSAY